MTLAPNTIESMVFGTRGYLDSLGEGGGVLVDPPMPLRTSFGGAAAVVIRTGLRHKLQEDSDRS